MSKINTRLKAFSHNLKHRSVIYNIDPLQPVVDEINKIDLSSKSNNELQQLSYQLRYEALNGASASKLLVPAYSLVREAAERVLNMRAYDVQLLAAIAIHDGSIVEMQTGEGKTLAAIFPAYINALYSRGVHILTFNDYLAKRDAEWMGPVYRFLGLSVGYISEGMSPSSRKASYYSDITYLTAKEAGFDFLKSFLCEVPEDLVQRPFFFSIVDEADSALIDEARIPLVIAGKTEINGPDAVHMASIIGNLEFGKDYSTDEYERNVFLTDEGLNSMEKLLGISNLYQERHIQLLADINNALHAHVLLKRDVDYIVRDGKIGLVDEFTGRIADKRHWPYGLQEAIEAKEGIVSEQKGQILASITLQNFIGLYPRVSGMTGTAQSSSDELSEFYHLPVVVIPTNRACIRQDNPDILYTHKAAKYNAVVKEVKTVHSTCRPILIGTSSVEESEYLAELFEKENIHCKVLNAKNDALEASIVAEAGSLGAITVSTNMAGRGTDIKLGGAKEFDHDKVVALGGLYVIGTNRHESRRIDDQLRGRAGRQGDPGSTRFFISLEDDLMKRYRLKDLIPASLYPKHQDAPLVNRIITREIARAQRIIEGQNFDIRRTLSKYSRLMETERRTMQQWRDNVLFGRSEQSIISEKLPDKYSQLIETIEEKAIKKAERQVTLYCINKCWADYLDYLSYMRESIHLVNLAGKNPIDEYNKNVIDAFNSLMSDIQDQILSILERVEITKDGVDMKREGLNAPSSTWTYMVNDAPEQLGILPISQNIAAAMTMGPLLIATLVYNRFFKKRENNS